MLIDYIALQRQALLNVVKQALMLVQQNQTACQIYITFNTQLADVPRHLKLALHASILLDQYTNLIVDDQQFSVELMFGNIQYRIVVPFVAITLYLDQAHEYALEFPSPNMHSDTASNMSDDKIMQFKKHD